MINRYLSDILVIKEYLTTEAKDLKLLEDLEKRLLKNELKAMSKNYKYFWNDRLATCADVARKYLANHPRGNKYRITCRAYDEDLNEWLEPVPVTIELTDEEYVTILSYMLSVSYQVTYNTILYYEPLLAQKINNQAIKEVEKHECQDLCPFIIQLDEFNHDRSQMPAIDEGFPF